MTQAIHSQARTTTIVLDEIRASVLPQAEVARMYNVTRHTIKKWKDRSDDASHRPKRMNTTRLCCANKFFDFVIFAKLIKP
jgi:DNA-binding transcriptional regulator YiaG